MHALLLLLCLSGGEPFRWTVDQPSFSWSITNGGDLESSAPSGAETLQDATPDVADPVRARSVASVSLKQAIADYRRNGGVKYWVRGKTDAQHVVEDHGWTYRQISGLSLDEIQFLHGASHTGALHPSSFVAANRNAAPFTPDSSRNAGEPGADNKPALTITLAPFHCPPCNQVKRMNWSDFDVTWQTGGRVERGYPEISWRDDSGKKWWKAGAYTPTQIKGLVERTQ